MYAPLPQENLLDFGPRLCYKWLTHFPRMRIIRQYQSSHCNDYGVTLKLYTYLKNLNDFWKAVETGLDPPLITLLKSSSTQYKL